MSAFEEPTFLGERGRAVKVNEFQGTNLFHLRQYFWSEEKYMWIPTKAGVTLNFQEFQELKATLPAIEEKFQKMEKEKANIRKATYHYEPYAKRQVIHKALYVPNESYAKTQSTDNASTHDYPNEPYI